MENNFVSLTGMVVNVAILISLLIVTGLGNASLLCPPPDFILNPENDTTSRCNYSEAPLSGLNLNFSFITTATNFTTEHTPFFNATSILELSNSNEEKKSFW